MWGPRAEIIGFSVTANLITIAIGLYCVSLCNRSYNNVNDASYIWVPVLAGAIAGVAFAHEALIARQYAVLEQVLHEVSAPPVSLAMRWPVGLGHVITLVPVLCATAYAEIRSWQSLPKAGDILSRDQYAWLTAIYILVCAASWIWVATHKPSFTN